MKKLSLMILFIFSVSGIAHANLGSIKAETGRFKEMVDRVSEKMSVEDAERVLEEREMSSEDDYRSYSLEKEATTLAAKMVLERSEINFAIICPIEGGCGGFCRPIYLRACGEWCDGTRGMLCPYGQSCNGHGVCEAVNPSRGG